MIDARNSRQQTPLHAAAIRGQAKAVKVLLNHGAREDLMNDDGQTPLEYVEARRYNYNVKGDYEGVIALLKNN